MRVADYLANYIYEELGVKHVFLVTGAGIMHLTNGVVSHKKLKAICPHHEQTSSMAMDAYSRVTENFSVGYFTTGPGCTNAITGLSGAWQDSVPCLFVSGNVKKVETSANAGIPKLRQFGVQELNIVPVVESICKYAVTLNDPKKIRYELDKAVYIAKSGRPGPVWIEIPMDVQSSQIDPESLEKFTPEKNNFTANPGQIEKIVNLLKESKRPVIIAGRGIRIARATKILAEFVEEFGIPVVTPFLAIDNIKSDHGNYIGKTGVKGNRPANFAMQNSDLILAIGTSLHVTVISYNYKQFAREAKKIVIDIDDTSHKKKTITIDHFIKADAKEALLALIQTSKKIGLNNYTDWLEQCIQWKKKYPVCLPEYKKIKNAINSYAFINQLSKQSSENDIFISDAGGTFYSISQGIQLTKSGQRYIPSGAMATMGFSLPAAIGASVATDGKRVLAITGDGSFQQNIQELQTLIEYNLPVKLFVLNNDGYESIRVSQKNYFNNRFIGESSQSGVSFPDTLKIASAYGIKAVRVSDYDKLEKVIDEVLNYDGPVICDVIAPRDQEIIPTVASKVNEDGTMSSRPLEDMYPFLDRDEYKNNLFVDEV